MNWNLVYLPEAAKDLKNLAGNQRLMVVKAIGKVLQNRCLLQKAAMESCWEISKAMICLDF